MISKNIFFILDRFNIDNMAVLLEKKVAFSSIFKIDNKILFLVDDNFYNNDKRNNYIGYGGMLKFLLDIAGKIRAENDSIFFSKGTIIEFIKKSIPKGNIRKAHVSTKNYITIDEDMFYVLVENLLHMYWQLLEQGEIIINNNMLKNYISGLKSYIKNNIKTSFHYNYLATLQKSLIEYINEKKIDKSKVNVILSQLHLDMNPQLKNRQDHVVSGIIDDVNNILRLFYIDKRLPKVIFINKYFDEMFKGKFVKRDLEKMILAGKMFGISTKKSIINSFITKNIIIYNNYIKIKNILDENFLNISFPITLEKLSYASESCFKKVLFQLLINLLNDIKLKTTIMNFTPLLNLISHTVFKPNYFYYLLRGDDINKKYHIKPFLNPVTTKNIKYNPLLSLTRLNYEALTSTEENLNLKFNEKSTVHFNFSLKENMITRDVEDDASLSYTLSQILVPAIRKIYGKINLTTLINESRVEKITVLYKMLIELQIIKNKNNMGIFKGIAYNNSKISYDFNRKTFSSMYIPFALHLMTIYPYTTKSRIKFRRLINIYNLSNQYYNCEYLLVDDIRTKLVSNPNNIFINLLSSILSKYSYIQLLQDDTLKMFKKMINVENIDKKILFNNNGLYPKIKYEHYTIKDFKKLTKAYIKEINGNLESIFNKSQTKIQKKVIDIIKNQISGFALYPPNFAYLNDLNNLKWDESTYEENKRDFIFRLEE